MRALACLWVSCLLGSDIVFEGKFDAQLAKQEERRWRMVALTRAAPEQRNLLRMQLEADEAVWTGEIGWSGQPRKHSIVLIDRGSSGRFLGIDLDRNGAYTTIEVRRVPQNAELLWNLPIEAAAFRTAPVLFRVSTPGTLGLDDTYQVRGKAMVRGVDTSFAWEFDAERGQLASSAGDLFRAGDVFVGLENVDIPNLRFRIRLRSSEDYARIEMTPGVEIPDFRFVDFEGRSRALSEFRGKYVLLDFWGAWCPPCIDDLPVLRTLYERYRSKGFEILGMTSGDDLEAARKAIVENNCEWTNARPDSIKEIISHRFGIESYPSFVLVDPQGRIHSSRGLASASLQTILESLLK